MLRVILVIVFASLHVGCNYPVQPAGGRPIGSNQESRLVVCEGELREVEAVVVDSGGLLRGHEVYYVAVNRDSKSKLSNHEQHAGTVTNGRTRKITGDLPDTHSYSWLQSLLYRMVDFEPRCQRYVLGFEPLIIAAVPPPDPNTPVARTRPRVPYANELALTTQNVVFFQLSKDVHRRFPEDAPVSIISFQQPVAISYVQGIITSGASFENEDVAVSRVKLRDLAK